MSVVMTFFERLVLSHLKDITDSPLDPLVSLLGKQGSNDADNVGLHYILQDLHFSGTDTSLAQRSTPRSPPLEVHTAHCAHLQLSVDQQLPDQQEVGFTAIYTKS